MAHTKVLVIDQDQGPYETLKLGLARRGYEMHATTTMASALALAGAHAYQAAFVSFTLVPNRALLDGLYAEIPDLPVILIHTPEHAQHIPPQMLEVAANAIGKPLALGPVCLMLDRTLGFSPRAVAAAPAILVPGARPHSPCRGPCRSWRGHTRTPGRGADTPVARPDAQLGTVRPRLAASGGLIVCRKAVADGCRA